MVKKPAKSEEDSRSGAVDMTVKAIQSKFGEGSLIRLGDVTKVAVKAIPTGSV